ncbi:hypothetical protein CL634_07075 [bacterium]|nr:hypothetical protein [bacterium]
MADINLLPDEMRSQEKREKKSSGEVKPSPALLHEPKSEPKKLDKPKAVKEKKNWLGKFFKKSNKVKSDTKKGDSKDSEVFSEIRSEMSDIEANESSGPVDLPTPVSESTPVSPSDRPPEKPSENPAEETVEESTEEPAAVSPDREQGVPDIKQVKADDPIVTIKKTKPVKVKKSGFLNKLFTGQDKKKSLPEKADSNSGVDVNLIPGGTTQKSKARRSHQFISLGIAALVAVGIVGLAYAGLVWYEKGVDNKMVLLRVQIEDLDSQIDSLQNQLADAENLQMKIELVKGLLDDHFYWTQFFTELEAATVDDVYYLNLAAGQTGTISLSAVGANYQSVARQLRSFEQANSWVDNVVINGANSVFDADGNILSVSFGVLLSLNPGALLSR